MQPRFYPRAQAYLRYFDFPGEEPPIVYIAGLGGAASAVYPAAIWGTELARHRTILPDLFGTGYSDRPEDFGYSMAEHAASVAWLLDELQAAACIVVGHSMGGAVAIELAAARPDLVTKLVLAESNLEGFEAPSLSEEEYLAGVLPGRIESTRQAAATDPGAAFVVGMWQIAAPRAFYRSRESLRCGTQPTWRQHLYELRMPRLFIFGDRSLPDPDTEALPAHGIETVVIPNAGHGMMWDDPAAFARAVAAFAAR